MNIQTIEEVKKPLPQLIKQSATYKLFVPKKVEEKIRYLIRKYPHTEWSGILFIRHAGTFENGDLEIYCEDLFPMDVGTGGWTEFKMTPDVTAYIAENIELFECDLALVHSHHAMGAFFSGQDTKTLQLEGNDINCFVSLIVDTRGTYQAAITRKLKGRKQVVTKYHNSIYEFFGEGTKELSDAGVGKTEETEEEVIEYFMLDVQREEVNNPLDYLDIRLEEIERQKKPSTLTPTITTGYTKGSDYDYDKDMSFREWLNKPKDTEEPCIFDAETMEEMVDADKWSPDPTIIHKLLCQMVTCSLIVGDIDLKQWITRHMVKKYDEIFRDSIQLNTWMEFIVEFILAQYPCDDVPDTVMDDFDAYQSKIAEALVDELNTLPSNQYLEKLEDLLGQYIYMVQ